MVSGDSSASIVVHVLAVHHDLADLDVAEVEDAAQHLPLVLDFRVGTLMQVDRAAQFFLHDLVAEIGRQLDVEEPQGRLHDGLHQPGDRRQGGDHRLENRRHRERHALGVVDRVALRQHLAENQHQQGHRDGRVDHARLAEHADQHAGRERRGQDVHKVVAEQDGADQTVALQAQPVDRSRPAIALLLQPVHARTGRSGQRRFRARQKRRDDQQQEDGAQDQQEGGVDFHAREEPQFRLGGDGLV